MPAATWRVYSGACAEWVANHAYSVGDRCVCTSAYGTTARRKYVWECTTAGTSHATTQPAWPDGPVTQTVADGAGTLVWTCRLPSDGNWLNATCYLGYLLSATGPVAAGDFVYVHNAHSESKNWAAHYALYGPASDLTPIFILCVNKDSSDALSTGAIVYNNTTSYYLKLLRCAYSYGVQYKGAVAVGDTSYGANWLLEANGPGTLVLYSTADVLVGFSANYEARLIVLNADIYLASGNYPIRPYAGGTGYFEWKNGALQGGPLSHLVRAGSQSYISRFFDIDLTAIGTAAGKTLMKLDNGQTFYDHLFSRCKLPGGSFTLWEGDDAGIWRGRIRVHHCSAADKYYDFCERDGFGTTVDEQTVVRTGGANDGTLGQSWKMVNSARAKDGYFGHESPPIHVWGDFAVEKTFTVEGIWDSATNIQNDEIWMELEYPADAASGLGAVSRIKCAILSAPADVTTSAAAWTTTGLTNPNAFKLQATVTPGKKGPVTAKIILAKASATVYIDPMITVS